MKAIIQDPQALVGKGIVNVRDRQIYRIKYVGREGVTAYPVDSAGRENSREQHEITWRAFKALYSIIVPVEQIDDGKLVKL